MTQQAERAGHGGFARGRGMTAVLQRRYALTEAGYEALRRAELEQVQSVLDRAHGVRAGGQR